MDAYKDNKNLHTSTLIKIITHYKLNKYNTINNHINTSTYHNILALGCKELYYTANSNFKNRGVNVNNFKNKDISTDNFKNKNISINNSKNKNANADGSKDKNINTDNSKDKNIGTNNNIKENNLNLNNNIN